MPLLSVSCRNNPVAGIMTIIPSAELATQLRGWVAVAMVPARGGCPIQSAQACDVHGACLDCFDCLLPTLVSATRCRSQPSARDALRPPHHRRCRMRSQRPNELGKGIERFFREYLSTLR